MSIKLHCANRPEGVAMFGMVGGQLNIRILGDGNPESTTISLDPADMDDLMNYIRDCRHSDSRARLNEKEVKDAIRLTGIPCKAPGGVL